LGSRRSVYSAGLTHYYIFPGPALPKNKFIVAINWTGITFLDEKERRLLQLSYPEVTGVNTMRYSSVSYRFKGHS
jgi:hypothetical protein